MRRVLPKDVKVGEDKVVGPSIKNIPVLVTSCSQDPDDPRYWEIKCLYGTFRAQYNELVSFPRRHDGSIKDWFALGETPTIFDICIGDILPPARTKPLDERTQRMWAMNTQMVRSVYVYMNTDEYMLQTETFGEQDDAGRPKIRNFRVKGNEPLIFPMVEHADLARARNRAFRMSGPYRLAERTGGDEDYEEYRFLIHPTGRGRWPADATPFGVKTPGSTVHIMRPPSDPMDWKRFVYAGDPGDRTLIRHPSDKTKEKRKQDYQNWKRLKAMQGAPPPHLQ